MTLVIQILYTTSWKELANIVLPVAEAYCKIHGYKLMAIEYPEYSSDFGFKKIEGVQKLFKEGVDCVWCLDLDCLLTLMSKPVEDYLDEEHDFFITKDFNNLNAGSFLVKNTAFSETFLYGILAQKGLPEMHCEQNGIIEAMKYMPSTKKIKILPQSSINAYRYNFYPEIPPQNEEQGEWVEGKSLVLHLPGTGLQTKIDTFRNTKITI